MNKFIPQKLADIEEYIPQSNAAEIILDANESPFVISLELQNELSEIVKNINFNRYPDAAAAEAVCEFSKVFNLNTACVVMGNGSDELISVIESGFLTSDDTIIVVVPDFSMYSFYSSIIGANVVKYIKEEDFEIDFDKLGSVCEDNNAKMVIFSNPCNPTSRSYEREKILKFIDSHNLIVVVDEAYMEFCGSNSSVLNDAENRENLIVLKTLSKAYGMAAIRAGFAVTNAEMALCVRKIKSPYNTSAFTQKAAAAILKYSDEIKINVRKIVDLKNYMYEALLPIVQNKNLKIYPSDTNFLLIRAGENAEKIYKNLLEKKIRVRLMGQYLRITTGNKEECEIFISAFKDCI